MSESIIQSPMMKLDSDVSGVPILSYNVPEPTSYTGQNYIELKFDDFEKAGRKIFKQKQTSLSQAIRNKKITDLFLLEGQEFSDKVSEYLTGSLLNSPVVNITLNEGDIISSFNGTDYLKLTSNSVKLSEKCQEIHFGATEYQLKNGNQINFYLSMGGELTWNWIPLTVKNKSPRLLLIESYKLSTYLGSYGAGRTIKTFTLLPGEKTKISIKSYSKSEESRKSTSSILDSFTQESADDFENSLESESTAKQNSSENFSYNLDAKASASWGWGDAEISGGVKGGTNSGREEFAKNIQKATSKHANKASAKRDIQINTSSEVTLSAGNESEIVRELENINVSRTLNFVFRQMNQEFITLLHLTDIRIAYYDGDPHTKMEYTLPELDKLLRNHFVPGMQDEVKDMIINQLLSITDYQDNFPEAFDRKGNPIPQSDKNGNKINGFIKIKNKLDFNGKETGEFYLQFAKDSYSKYADQNKREIYVDGIILSANKNVLRTDGVIVDSILGQGNALDDYSLGLQNQAVREKELINDLKLKEAALKDFEIAKQKMMHEIITSKDLEKAKIFEMLYPKPIVAGNEK